MGVESFTFDIPGVPRTKKNSGRIVWDRKAGRRKLVPSEASEAWYAMACTGLPRIRWAADLAKVELPIRVEVSAECAIFLGPGNTGDPVNYYQAIADFMESVGILANDKQIRHWDGTRVHVAAEEPRITVRLWFLSAPEKATKGRGKRG